MKKRTRAFALDIIHLVEKLPGDKTGDILGMQLMMSGTSVGANYRSACRARSTADFISKIIIVEEEADESMYWLELIRDCRLLPENHMTQLILEANELVAIFAATAKSAKQNKSK